MKRSWGIVLVVTVLVIEIVIVVMIDVVVLIYMRWENVFRWGMMNYPNCMIPIIYLHNNNNNHHHHSFVIGIMQPH